MPARADRLKEFNTDCAPSSDQPVEVLCEDNSGTYLLPFASYWANGAWHNASTGKFIEGNVVGWRLRDF